VARARNIKPSIYVNEELAELPIAARWLFVGLWTMADREGRMEDRPRRIKMTIFPGDTIDVEPLLDGLAGKELIVRYEVEGAAYIWIPGFAKHQKPHHREVESVIPAYEGKDKAAPRHGSGTTQASASPSESPFPLTDCSSLQKKARKRAPFVKPTVSEVAEYVRNRGSPVDAEAFVAFYESKGWKVGKEPMSNWKAAIVTWEKRHETDRSSNGKPVRVESTLANLRRLAGEEGCESLAEADGDVWGQVYDGVFTRAE
jgi:hypothetical protein